MDKRKATSDSKLVDMLFYPLCRSKNTGRKAGNIVFYNTESGGEGGEFLLRGVQKHLAKSVFSKHDVYRPLGASKVNLFLPC